VALVIIGAIVAAIVIGRNMSGDEKYDDSLEKKITDVVPLGIEGMADKIIDAVVDPVSNKPGVVTVKEMVRGSSLKQIVVYCKEVVAYGLKFQKSLIEKLATASSDRNDILSEITSIQKEIPLFPNDPKAQAKWFDYFAKPDFGAKGVLSMAMFRKKLEEVFMSRDQSQWMGPSEIIDKIQKITDAREEFGLTNKGKKGDN